MAQSLLSKLGKSAAQAYPIIQRGIREGLSANAIQKVLRDSGLGVRRTSLLEVVRAERGVQEAGERLRFLRPDRRPDPSRLPLAITKQRRLYSYTIRIRGADPFTAEPFERWFNVSSDQLLTRNDVEAIAEEFSREDGLSPTIGAREFQLVRAQRAGPAGLL